MGAPGERRPPPVGRTAESAVCRRAKSAAVAGAAPSGAGEPARCRIRDGERRDQRRRRPAPAGSPDWPAARRPSSRPRGRRARNPSHRRGARPSTTRTPQLTVRGPVGLAGGVEPLAQEAGVGPLPDIAGDVGEAALVRARSAPIGRGALSASVLAGSDSCSYLASQRWVKASSRRRPPRRRRGSAPAPHRPIRRRSAGARSRRSGATTRPHRPSRPAS